MAVGILFIVVAIGLSVFGLRQLGQQEIISTGALTGRASDSFLFLCINDPPTLSFACQAAMNQSTRVEDNTVACLVNASDQNGDTFSYEVAADTPGNWSWTNASGTVFFRPRQGQVGAHSFNITAEDASGCFNDESAMAFNFTVLDINDPPDYIENMTDLEMDTGESLSPYSLYEFFQDPDGDLLDFTVLGENRVEVTINPLTGATTYSSDGCGTDYLLFRGTDPFSLSAESGVVEITVICPDEDNDGGGGGGGGGTQNPCTPKWRCKEWSECFINGTRKKECVDLNGCKQNDLTRVFWENCTYIPTCSDGVQNQGETAIDCGGPCKPCGTCFDAVQNNDEEGLDCGGAYCEPCKNCTNGIQDWKETAIDCGGPCLPCPTCSDGIQNQGETAVDCGGPCAACMLTELPGLIIDDSHLITLLLLTIASLIALFVIYRIYHRKIAALLARLGLAFTRKRRKQILLSEEEKHALLKKTAALLKGIREMREAPSVLGEAIAKTVREFYAAALDLEFTLTQSDVDATVAAKVYHSSLKHVLSAYFSPATEVERVAAERSYEEYGRLAEELRLIVLLCSKVEADDLGHDAAEKEIAGSATERFWAGLENIFLALEFEEAEAAKKRYLELVVIYEQFDEKRKALTYAALTRAYHEIRYELSWTK
jgi:hypothetical protein